MFEKAPLDFITFNTFLDRTNSSAESQGDFDSHTPAANLDSLANAPVMDGNSFSHTTPNRDAYTNRDFFTD